MSKMATAKKLIPERLIRLSEVVLTISSQNDLNLDSSEEEIIHDRLVDEDIEYKEYHGEIDNTD